MDDGTGSGSSVVTSFYPVMDCDSVVICLVADSFIGNGVNSTLTVNPVSCVFDQYPVEFTTGGFTVLNAAGTFPSVEHIEVSTLGAFLGFIIWLKDSGGMGASLAAKIAIWGVGVV